MKQIIAIATAVIVGLCSHGALTQAADYQLPLGLVFLRDVAPSIIQDIRYAGRDNFTGRPIVGYDAAECILTERTALALKSVQASISPRYSLKVFDCYRPRMAVADMLIWSQDGRQDPRRKAIYHPLLDKSDLFDRGFISRRSRHSRGFAVDLTIITTPVRHEYSQRTAAPCSKAATERAFDSNLDFGTGFDCFDHRSATSSGSISAEAKMNRDFLLSLMRKAGFSNYSKEWWHFELDGSSNSPEYNVKVTSRKREASASPDLTIPPTNPCGTSEPLRIVCSSNRTSLALYEGPSLTTKQLGELPTDGLVNCLHCTGRETLAAYVKLDALSKSVSNPPWCKVRGPDRLSGWVDGRFLAPVNETAVECP